MLKRRTRGHIIADLSINYVERQALLTGYTCERTIFDYGIDLVMTTYNAKGEVEAGFVLFQVKATDALRFSSDRANVLFVVKRPDVQYWLLQDSPVMLVIYDGQNDRAYWLYVQAYFQRLPNFDKNRMNQTITLRVPATNILDTAAMRAFARSRDRISQQSLQVTHHDA